MSKPLSERIATALRGKPTAAELAKLIDEAGEAVANAAIEKAEAEAIAIDPLADSKAVDAAHKSLDAIGLNVRRLESAVTALRDKHAAALEAEREAAALVKYEAIEAERDELVELIRTVYADAVPKLAELAERIAENNTAINNMNIPPAGKPNIERAEKIARGVAEGNWLPTIVGSLRLPRADNSGWLAYPKGQSR